MDSQSNALYDNLSFPEPTLSELSFNATNGQSKPKTPKYGHAACSSSKAASPSGRRFIILPAGASDSRKLHENPVSPFLSPSASFVTSKHHHSMKSLKLGKFIILKNSPRYFQSNGASL